MEVVFIPPLVLLIAVGQTIAYRPIIGNASKGAKLHNRVKGRVFAHEICSSKTRNASPFHLRIVAWFGFCMECVAASRYLEQGEPVLPNWQRRLYKAGIAVL